MEWLPVILAKVRNSSSETFKKFATRWAAASVFSRSRSSGFCVATPTGQLPLPQIRYCWQAAAINPALAIATASAPIASALAKSADTRSPPVITREMSEPMESRYFLAR